MTTPHGTEAIAAEFWFNASTDSWWWSKEMFAIHGFAPHEIVPTVDVVIAHAHPEHREKVTQTLVSALAGHTASTLYELADATGRDHLVALTLAPAPPRTIRRDRDIRVAGHLMDLTQPVSERANALASEAIAASAASRAAIEQAVGVIAFVEQTDTAGAFEVLRSASNHTNLPIRKLAGLIVDTLPRLEADPRRLHAALDELTVTHEHQHAN